MPWEVPNEWLVTLCEGCHKEAHGLGDIDGKPKKVKKSRKAKKVSKANTPEMKERMIFEL